MADKNPADQANDTPPEHGRAPRKHTKGAELTIRRERAMELRVKGWSIRAIAAQLRISLAVCHSDIESVLEASRKDAYENAERHIQLSLERLDVATKALETKVEQGDARAIDTLIRLEERRAKLLGLDAATRYEHSGPAGAPITIDARDALLQKLASLAAGGATVGDAGGVPPKPEPG